jgi:hypothetical protein
MKKPDRNLCISEDLLVDYSTLCEEYLTPASLEWAIERDKNMQHFAKKLIERIGCIEITQRALFINYALATERVRRHKRTMRENRCSERDAPCWMDFKGGDPPLGAADMCDECLMRQIAYQFRVEAMAELKKARRLIEKHAKSLLEGK